jgi:hypothetical protein
MLARCLVATAAAIALYLGSAHVIFTLRGPLLRPRDAALEERMRVVSPVITGQTTMWRVWIGVNASHGFGLVLFAAVYGYLALAEPGVLFGSVFLPAVGGLLLLGYVVLAKTCFFRAPLRAVIAASACFAAGIVRAWM